MDYSKLYGDKHVPKSATEAKPVTLPDLPDNADIKARAQAVEADIFSTYYTIMMDDEAPLSVRKSCADALADRARGKPAQEIEHSGKVQFEQLIIMRTPKTIDLPVVDGKIVE